MIIPAILEKDLGEFAKKIKILEAHFDRFHIDVIDDSFQNRTLGIFSLPVFEQKKFIEVHLMVDSPELEVRRMSGKNIDLVFGQIERIRKIDLFLRECELEGFEPGFCIDLQSAINRYKKEIKKVRRFILMAVKAGKSGQEFDNIVLGKITQLREYVGESAEILVDGGINSKTMRKSYRAGADGVLVNSFLWEDFENNLYQMRLIDKD